MGNQNAIENIDLHPSVEDVVRGAELDRTHLQVSLAVTERRIPNLTDWHQIPVSDGNKSAVWTVPSLRGLFRGDKVPPAFREAPDREYMPLFYFIEQHAVRFCTAAGDKTDGDFEEAYSNLRRRPDGKPLSDLQAFLWQAAALLAAFRPLSAAEFEGILGRLTRSASTFRMGLVSRNYIETLRQSVMMGR